VTALRLTLLFGCWLLTGIAQAQQRTVAIPDESGDLVHFTYATLLGTGIYRLDDRTATIFRIPLGWTLREVTPEKFGIGLRMPVAVGFFDFDVLDDLIPDGDQLSTISVVPGIELSYLIGDWRVAPAVYLGAGYDMTNDETSIIYGGGISVLRPLKLKYPEMNFGTALLLSGYEPEQGEGDYITRWSAGFDAKFATGWNIGNRNIFIGGHTIGYFYLNKLQFQTITDTPIEINKELEFGIFIGARPEPEIFGIKINRLGMGYRFSSQSDALVFFAGFPF
jgi:hypothetical protein